MSVFTCEVVPVVLEPHPNADKLAIVRIGGYTVGVRKDEWAGRDRGVYIPPDSVVPRDERFEWLFQQQKNGRVRVKKFRGHYSQGVLMPCPDGTPIGTDMATAWGITHWEPPVPLGCTDGNPIAGPPGLVIPKYDVENYQRFPDAIRPGELVYVTEKIHGCNARYVWDGDQMYCGSRTQWKENHPRSLWWNTLQQAPWIEPWCREHPKMVLFGEIYGHVQDLRYGAKDGEYSFRVFDILENGCWVDYARLENLMGLGRAPVLAVGPFEPAKFLELAESDSVLCPGQMMEGVVVCTVVERTHPRLGRCQVKMVSNRYLERDG